jgi:signal transduction histidine kinase
VLVAAWLAVLASQVHFGLRPLHHLGAQLERVRSGDAQRIETQGLGAEVAPLGEELNALLDHQQRMVARARTSAQDLAHALKTPLSVLATEADGDGAHWRATVREQSARMQASVDRYLAAGLAADHRQRTGVAAVAQAMCRLMARVHGERGITFTAAGIEPALQFAGASADLEEMLGNLLDNAGRWAQRQVQVSAEADDGQLRIEVRDDGPGLAADALQRVTQRGVRLDERVGSSGLGLAIVGDIAASYGGRVALENVQLGLRATLWLPVG